MNEGAPAGQIHQAPLRNLTLCHREERRPLLGLERRRDLPHVKVEIASQTTLAMTGLVFLSF